MVAPLRPYLDVKERKNFEGKITYTHVRQGFRQKKPYTINTAMSVGTGFSSGTYDATVVGPSNSNPLYVDLRKEVGNRAYEKALSKLGDGSSFGATLTAERKETWATVVGLITNIANSAKKMRSGDIPGAMRLLGVSYREVTESRVLWTHRRDGSRKRAIRVRHKYLMLPTGRRVLKTAASGWLLWSYGVKPLAEDIYNGMDVLQRPLPDSDRIIVGSTGSLSTSWLSSSGKEFSSTTLAYSVRWGFRVRVSNPNLWLANKLGLINPASWVLEGIPFSFVVDWFSNLSTVVGSFTDFTGLEVTDTWVSTSHRWSESWANTAWEPSASGRRSSFHYERLQGSLSPQLRFAYERFNWQRGLNAISLLVGFLPK